MLGRLEALLVTIGQRVEWDAVAAIGTVGAFIWAISLANRQSADQRRRDHATEKAIHAILDGAEVAALQCHLAWRTWTRAEAHAGAVEAGKAGETFYQVRKRALHVIHEALERLRAIDVLRLPSDNLVDLVQGASPKLIDLAAKVGALEARDRYEHESLQLEAAIGSLRAWTTEAAQQGLKPMFKWSFARKSPFRETANRAEEM